MTIPVAILLGALVRPDGTASRTLRRRAEVAAALYHEGRVNQIIATGGVGPHPPSEASATAAVLRELGVPEDAITLEERSRTTVENIRFAMERLPHDASVVLVSDVWHLPRARFIARRLGLRTTGASPPLRGSHPLRTLRLILRELGAWAAYLLGLAR